MPFQSSFPPITIPENVDIWTFLFGRKSTTRGFADEKEILTDGLTGRTYTFAHLHQASHDFGQGLKARWAWQKGHVLAFYTPSNIDTAVVTLGTLWAGGIISPANPLCTVDELTFQLRNSQARGLVTQRAFLPTARGAARKAGLADDRIILIGEARDESGKHRHFQSIHSVSYTGRYAPPRFRPKEDVAFLVYSSGTTGPPKGVCLSHYAIIANLLQFAATDGRIFLPYGRLDGKGDKQLNVLPFFQIYGIVCGLLASILFGWQLIALERFELETVCQTIERYGITFVYVPPPGILALSKEAVVDKYDLSSLRSLHSGVAPLSRELVEAVWARLKTPVKQGFGLSEASAVCYCQTLDEWAKFTSSVGKLAPNMEAKIVDEKGVEVPEGETGELWLKGPNLFLGYLGDPKRTKAAFSPCGYFMTGNVFRRDRYGNYYYVDRLKELIKYKGFAVSPAELEGLLTSRPDIADACVIGINDPTQTTEIPRAYIVLILPEDAPSKPSSINSLENDKAREIADWITTQVAPHKGLHGGVRIVESVPKSPSGKILRWKVREWAKRETRTKGPRL